MSSSLRGSLRVWALVVVALLAALSFVAASPAPDAMARPVRPKTFDSPGELRAYLDQLGQYYAVAGRPRFGKRVPHGAGVVLPIENINLRYPETNDLYDFIYQPQDD